MSTWIGVDLDGTLADYSRGWNGGIIGPPIPAMVERVKSWLAWSERTGKGPEVRIMTARVCPIGRASSDECSAQEDAIKLWCKEHLGKELPVTCTKDYEMIELWDDRAVQVIPNTGKRADGRD